MKEILLTYLARNVLVKNVANKARRALSGIEGEADFARLVQEYTGFDQNVMHNLYLEFHSLCQIDNLILTNGVWYAVEVKNNVGEIVINGDRATVNGKEMGNHPYHQMRRALAILEDIAQRIDPTIVIVPVLVYINVNCHAVDVGSHDRNQFFTPKLLNRGQIRQYLFNLKRETKNNYYSANQLAEIKQKILQYHSPADYLKITYGDLQYDQVKLGLNCPKCRSFDLRLNHRAGECLSCGTKCWKRDLLEHAIKEFIRIYSGHYLTTGRIAWFTKGQLDSQLISRYLSNNFKVGPKNKKKFYLHERK